ncbi:hypothetical protein HDU98_011281 [Podochytrium sp. JEL0797]|nr:hypothetical protein HDU98_011281 [Podochytrium sp. JEL0797]
MPDTPASNWAPTDYSSQWDLVIAGVAEHEAFLLDDSQWATVYAFQGLSSVARRLFIRFMLRTHKIERISKLNIEPTLKEWNMLDTTEKQLLNELSQAGLIDADPAMDAERMLKLISRPELLILAKQYKIPKPTSLSVPALQAALLSNAASIPKFSFSKAPCQNPLEILSAKLKSLLGPCLLIPPTIVSTFYRLFIIYNRERHWPENPFLPHILTNLRSDSNRVTFNTYTIHRISITWPTSHDLTEYMSMMKLQFDVHALLDPISGSTTAEDREAAETEAIRIAEGARAVFEAWVVAFPGDEGHVSGIPWLTCFTAGMKAMSVLRVLADLYAKRGRFVDACEVYEALLGRKLVGVRRHRGGIWDDYMKLLVKMKKEEDAWRVGCDALQDSTVEFGKRREIENRLVKLNKKLGKKEQIIAVDRCVGTIRNIETRVVHTEKTFSQTGRKALYKDLVTSEDVQVEQLALNEFQRLGYKGVHAENSVVMTLFGLLFWDILFDDSVPGAFATPFQDAPMDLTTEFFYLARKSRIDQRLSDLALHPDTLHLEIISRIDETHRPTSTQCRGVYWNLFTREDLLEVASCFTGTQLARICDAFIQSYGAHAGGVPDLCVWKVDGDVKDVRLVEVKGEGDHLSHSQIMWLDLMASVGICVELFKVQLTNGAKRKRIK